MVNNQSILDTRKVLTGKDGVLLNDQGVILATVESFQAQANVTNATYQPLGDAQAHEVLQSYGITLTMTQITIEDDALITEFIDGLNTGKMPLWNFQGLVRGYNGSEERINYRSCVPSGTVDLQNLTVGDIIKRAWSMFCNEPPALQSMLTA